MGFNGHFIGLVGQTLLTGFISSSCGVFSVHIRARITFHTLFHSRSGLFLDTQQYPYAYRPARFGLYKIEYA